MEKIKAKDGGYLTQATLDDESKRMFVRAVLTPNASLWKDATQAEKDAWEEQHPNPSEEDAEPTIEEQNDALLQYVNDKTNGNHADLSAAVESLVNNN